MMNVMIIITNLCANEWLRHLLYYNIILNGPDTTQYFHQTQTSDDDFFPSVRLLNYYQVYEYGRVIGYEYIIMIIIILL